MKQLIQLTPTNLIAVEVPEDAEQFSLTKFKEHAVLNYKIKDDNTPLGYQNWSENIGIEGFNRVLKDCKVLGEVTKEGIQFDVEPYILKYKSTLFTWLSDVYYDYFHDGWDFENASQKYKEGINKTFPFETPQESFQSLLQVNNVEIPEGKKLLIFFKEINMKQTIYYTVELQLDSSYSWNGLRTITGYMSELYTTDLTDEIQEKGGQFTIKNRMVKLFEIVAETDGDWQYLLSDKEEIQQWLDNEGDENDYEFIQL